MVCIRMRPDVVDDYNLRRRIRRHWSKHRGRHKRHRSKADDLRRRIRRLRSR